MRQYIVTPLLPLLPLLAASCLTTGEPHAEPESPPAPETQVQVMILGTYHFAGSSSDLINVEMDSVLTDEHQLELEALASAIAEFKPNIVVTERVTAEPDYVDPVYGEYTPEWLRTRSNERVQLAYRVAHKLGLQVVHGLDEQPAGGEPDYFPFDKVVAHAARTGQGEALTRYLDDTRAMATREVAALNELTIPEALLVVNTGPTSKPDFYYAIGTFDQGEAQPAAELQAYWFMRNAKIFSKLDDVTQAGDRVLVVYGAGHKFWLEHCVSHTPGYELVRPDPYLRQAARELKR